MKLGRWSTTAASNNNAPPDGWPEGQAPSTVNDCAREMMASIRAVFSDLQFFDQDFTPTYVSATSFTIPGDQTSAIHAGRRLKLYDATAGAATVIYATVATASFTVVTTVSVANDAGQLTSSLSSFAIAILSNTNNSLPRSSNTSFDRFSASAIETTTLSVNGAATLNSTLSVSGSTVLKGALSVGGAVNIKGPAGTTLITVNPGAAAAYTSLEMHGIGDSKAAGITITGGDNGGYIDGGFTRFRDDSSSASFAIINSTGISTSGKLVSNGITNDGTLTVSGATTLNNGLSVTGALFIKGLAGATIVTVSPVSGSAYAALALHGIGDARSAGVAFTGGDNGGYIDGDTIRFRSANISSTYAVVDSSGFSVSGKAAATTFLKSGGVTVASLPAAATAGLGARYMVTDASSLTFGASASGGGANIAPVWSDGTSWLIG